MGSSFDRLYQAAVTRELLIRPGYLKDREDPLPLGSIVDLRRDTIPPGKTPKHPRDAGWVVAGYLQEKNGGWRGYQLVRGAFSIERATLTKYEAYDLVERYEVPVT